MSTKHGLTFAMAAVLLVSSVATSPAQDPESPDVALDSSFFEIDGIRSGLERSPDDFVAGVFEYTGPIQCDSRGRDAPLCWAPARMVDEIASRPASKSPRTHLKILTAHEAGRRITGRALAFLVPMEGTDVYAGTFMTTYGEKKHQRFRQLVETAITGERGL